jgi:AcrR family transcriptional regulator
MLGSETKTQKSKQTKQKILSIAKMVFAQKGFNQSTVRDITQKAGLGYGTFYLYFKDKKEVFYALVEQVEDELYTASEGGSDLEQDYQRGRSSYRALRKDLKAILKSFCDNHSILKFSQELALIDQDFQKKYFAMRERLIDRTKNILKKSGLAAVDLDVAAIAIAGMIEATANECAQIGVLDGDVSNINIDKALPTLTKLYFKAVS